MDLSDLPGIDSVPDFLRMLMTIGLAGLLVILRFDAERFNAAEYNDIDRWGRKPSLARRLAWYVLGIGLILVVMKIYPDPVNDLYLSLGDRLGAVVLGLAYGAIGTGIALGIAFYRYHYLRFPGLRMYPSNVLNAIATAFFDEAVFRGILLGLLLMTPMNPNLANLTQALLYALATRLGAPGRPWYMLAVMIAIGLASGWLTVITGGIGAAFIGHCDHPRRDLPHHGPRRHPEGEGHRGRGDRAPPPDARGLAGPRPAVGRHGRARGGAARHGTGRASARRALRPRPVLRLAVPVLRLRRLRGCGGARAPGAGRRVRRGAAAELGAAGGRARTPRSGRRGPRRARRSRRVYLGGGTPTLLPAESVAAILALVRRPVGDRRRRRGHDRVATPARTSGVTRRRWSRRA